jgi:hypothetical protein
MAEATLAGAHRHGRVALRKLDRVEALGDRPPDVLHGHVFADADEALTAALERRRRNGGGAALARHGADCLHVGREVTGDEDRARRVVFDSGAGLREQGVRGLPTARHDEQIAVDRATVDLHRPNDPAPPTCDDLDRPSAAEAHDLGNVHACVPQVARCGDAVLVRSDHDGSLAGLERPVAHQTSDRAGEHDPDEVVAGKDQRLLDRPGCDDDPLCPEAQQDVSRVHRYESALVDAERAGRRENLDGRAADSRAWPVDPLVDENDVIPAFRGRPRCRNTCGAASDDEDVRAAMLDVEPL